MNQSETASGRGSSSALAGSSTDGIQVARVVLLTRGGVVDVPWRILFAIALTCGISDAAFEMRPVSALAGGVADAGTALASGVESLFGNPGGMVWGVSGEALAVTAYPFGLKELVTQGLGAAGRRGRAAVGVAVLRFGYEAFREQSVLLAAAGRFRSRLGLGLRLRILSARGDGFATASWTVFDLGFRARLGAGTWFGMTAWNTGGAGAGIVGRGGSAGLSCQVSPEATLSVDIQKESGRSTGFRAGLSFRPGAGVVLRLGAGSHPESLAAGTGLRIGSVLVDYAVSDHLSLGLSHRVSVRVTTGDP